MTCFRTSITQLQSAEGMVRCGACLKIFVADDNLVPSPDLRTVNAPRPEENEQQLPLDEVDEEFADSIFTLDLADSLPGRPEPAISEHQPIWELLDEGEPAPELRKQILDDFPDAPPPSAHFTPENLAAARDIADPLELHWQPADGRKRSVLLMSFLSLLLTAGLFAQFVWYNFGELSQNENVRPWLEKSCALLTCSLPALVDIRSISSENLLVRSHTEIANALTVNLVFRNNAAYPQPFPALILRFTDTNNSVVAERRFTPEEYLPTDVSTTSMMPAGAPVQITLEVLDPGSSAINYEVSFSPMFSQSRR